MNPLFDSVVWVIAQASPARTVNLPDLASESIATVSERRTLAATTPRSR